MKESVIGSGGRESAHCPKATRNKAIRSTGFINKPRIDILWRT